MFRPDMNNFSKIFSQTEQETMKNKTVKKEHNFLLFSEVNYYLLFFINFYDAGKYGIHCSSTNFYGNNFYGITFYGIISYGTNF